MCPPVPLRRDESDGSEITVREPSDPPRPASGHHASLTLRPLSDPPPAPHPSARKGLQLTDLRYKKDVTMGFSHNDVLDHPVQVAEAGAHAAPWGRGVRAGPSMLSFHASPRGSPTTGHSTADPAEGTPLRRSGGVGSILNLGSVDLETLRGSARSITLDPIGEPPHPRLWLDADLPPSPSAGSRAHVSSAFSERDTPALLEPGLPPRGSAMTWSRVRLNSAASECDGPALLDAGLPPRSSPMTWSRLRLERTHSQRSRRGSGHSPTTRGRLPSNPLVRRDSDPLASQWEFPPQDTSIHK